jgi:hypothetical protein
LWRAAPFDKIAPVAVGLVPVGNRSQLSQGPALPGGGIVAKRGATKTGNRSSFGCVNELQFWVCE